VLLPLITANPARITGPVWGLSTPHAKESFVNADLSVAPEIAQLAAPLALVPSPQRHAPARLTAGQLATALSRLAAAPQRWWDLVRFNPDGPARIAVPAPFEAWLLVIPPGQAAECRCELATQVAGDAAEGAGSVLRAVGVADAAGRAGAGRAAERALGGRRLRQGRVLVHAPGSRHVIRSAGHGYSVTLHAGWRA
jgi:hypothetical protein